MSESKIISTQELEMFAEVSTNLYAELSEQLKSFFNKKKGVQFTARQLTFLTEMLSVMYEHPSLNRLLGKNHEPIDHCKMILNESFDSRYQGLFAIANSKDGGDETIPLVKLVRLINDELNVYKLDFDNLLFSAIHIPTLAAQAYHEHICGQLEQFSRTYQSASPLIGEVFELYTSVREMKRICEEIGVFFFILTKDFRVSKKFKMTEWFKSFVQDWLNSSGSNIIQWVKSSVDNDKCERISPASPFSTSIVDIFTSSQQLLEQVKILHWPNELEAQLFYFRLLLQVLEALFYYTQLLVTEFTADLAPLRSIQKVTAQKAAKIGKLKIKLPKLNKKVDASPLDNRVARLSPKACVRLLNIQALTKHFQDLVAEIPRIKEDDESLPKNHLFIDDNLYILHLRIIRAASIKVHLYLMASQLVRGH